VKTKIILVLAVFILFVAGGCQFFLPSGSPHLRLGNPSNAGNDPNNYLIQKSQYVLSYNRERATPNWVAWQLNSSWLGDTQRQNDFRPDDSLPSDWYRVKPGDYTNSGYDRGHMVPSADRTASEQDNEATFVMTNIVPQTPINNRETWKNLEEYCRELVKQGKELYIIAGVYGDRALIGKNQQITVPSNTWKIVAVLDRPGERIRESTRVIAVDVPNRNKLAFDWEKYLVSVDEIEVKTGYDFFNRVPESIQRAIEARVDAGGRDLANNMTIW
jgi:endonuclease G, mitochondrial